MAIQWTTKSKDCLLKVCVSVLCVCACVCVPVHTDTLLSGGSSAGRGCWKGGQLISSYSKQLHFQDNTVVHSCVTNILSLFLSLYVPFSLLFALSFVLLLFSCFTIPCQCSLIPTHYVHFSFCFFFHTYPLTFSYSLSLLLFLCPLLSVSLTQLNLSHSFERRKKEQIILSFRLFCLFFLEILSIFFFLLIPFAHLQTVVCTPPSTPQVVQGWCICAVMLEGLDDQSLGDDYVVRALQPPLLPSTAGALLCSCGFVCECMRV